MVKRVSKSDTTRLPYKTHTQDLTIARQLSGGEEQRVAIARAFVTDPTFMLADEPTGDLDAQSAEDVLEVLKTLNQDFGRTIIMVTHDPRAARYASVTHCLDKGICTERSEKGAFAH
jgi:putative ABC transport system ATP-binding protein